MTPNTSHRPALIALWRFVVRLPVCDADGTPNATRRELLAELESVLAGERRPRPLLLRLGRGLPRWTDGEALDWSRATAAHVKPVLYGNSVPTVTERTWRFYDNAGRPYGYSVMRVAALVRKHGLPKSRIWGNMAVDSEAWDRLMDCENKRQQTLSVSTPETC